MAQAADSKPPMIFVVLGDDGVEWVVPPVHTAFAGGNSVMIVNTLTKPLTVTHNRHLDAPDPFNVPARGSGGPPNVTYPVAPGADVPESIFTIHIDGSPVRALGLAGDPTIIIL